MLNIVIPVSIHVDIECLQVSELYFNQKKFRYRPITNCKLRFCDVF